MSGWGRSSSWCAICKALRGCVGGGGGEGDVVAPQNFTLESKRRNVDAFPRCPLHPSRPAAWQH